MTTPNPKANAYTVLIGATGGIGQEIAKQLCASSRPVILVGRNTEKLTELHRRLAQDYPNLEIQSFECDLSVTFSQDELMAALNHLIMHPTNNSPNRIDTVILNAGINDFAMLTDQSDDMLEQMMLVNIAYPMQLIKRLLPIMIAQDKPAQIINIGSTFGSIGYPGFSAYSASKFALRGATEALGREYSDTSIRFRYFAPRATKTTMNNDAVVAMNNELKVNMDSPETVATALVEFLSTKEISQHLGFPERFFAWLNRVLPSIVGNAIIKDLPIIKRHAQK